MTVWIDNRAGSKDLVKYSPLNKVGTLTRLSSADVSIEGNGPKGTVSVGVEVKSIWDLISSMNTGRLQATQVPAMLDAYDVPWVLVYGQYQPSTKDDTLLVRRGTKWKTFSIGNRAVPYGYVEAMLLDLTVLGIRVKKVDTIREAAAWIGVLYRWWSKPWSKHRGMHTFDNSRDVSLMPVMDAETALRARIAAQLPGVGFERAVSAATHFCGVYDMLIADEDEWARVPGIGKVIAKTIVEALQG